METEELTNALTSYVASHSMLLLATAVHFMPTLQPYGHLLWLMRGISLLFLVSGVVRCFKYLQEATSCMPE